MFCFDYFVLQNKMFEKPHMRPCTRLWMTRNTGLKSAEKVVKFKLLKTAAILLVHFFEDQKNMKMSSDHHALSLLRQFMYRKVASSRLVYYSILNSWCVLLTETGFTVYGLYKNNKTFMRPGTHFWSSHGMTSSIWNECAKMTQFLRH